MPESEAIKKLRRSTLRAIRNARRMRELTPGLIEAAYEAATAREWLCPRHGPVGLDVNAMNACVRKVKTEEDGTVVLCEQLCAKNGPLVCGAREIAAVTLLFQTQTADREVILRREGFEKTAEIHNHTHNTAIFTMDQMALLSPAAREEVERLTLNRLHGNELPTLEVKV